MRPGYPHNWNGARHPLQESGPSREVGRLGALIQTEGIVAKHRNGIHDTRRPAWIKIKNPDYSQAVGRMELFEVSRLTTVPH